MFKNRNLFILFAVTFQILINEYINSQDYWNILVTKERFYSIKLSGTANGWAVGENGLIIKTTDGGENWRFSSIGEYTIKSCYFLNISTGFLCCFKPYSEGKIYKTTNGGDNWIQRYTTPFATYIFFNEIRFADSLNGWAIGNEGKILKTSNGGNNWADQTSNVNTDLYSIFMLNSNTGFITGGWGYNRKLLKTTNGGQNWQTAVADSGQWMQKIFFINNSTGWILNNPGSVSRTTNGGQNWIEYVHNIYGNFSSFYFTNAATGWMAGSLGIYKTTNSAVNWSPQLYTSNPDSLYYFCDVFFTNSTSGIAVGILNHVYKTTNGGNNWYRTLNSIDGTIKSVYFASDYTGWAATNLGEILVSTNGGLNWISQYRSVNFSFNSIHFSNSLSGWVAGINGNILRTSNGGGVWENIYCGQQNEIYSIFFRNQTGWISGSQGMIAKSVNSGINWTILSSGVNGKLHEIFFRDENTGWVAGDSTFLVTTNSGSSWQNLDDSSYIYRSICFPTALTGYVSAYKTFYYYNPNRKILKTTDGGASWNTVYRNYGIEFSDIHFFDSTSGYAVSKNGEILLTTNGGSYWFDDRVNFLFIKPYNTVFARSREFAWAAGDSGTVVSKYYGSPIGISNISNSIPSGYFLSQNYPNPFNPVTRIRFNIHQKSYVTIKIFDVLGREVSILVNELKNPGICETVFDGTDLSSGLYFYRLETEEYTETKKMVLIK